MGVHDGDDVDLTFLGAERHTIGGYMVDAGDAEEVSDGCSRAPVTPGQPTVLPLTTCSSQPVGIVGYAFDSNGIMSGISQLTGVAAPAAGATASATLPAMAGPSEMSVHLDNLPAGANLEVAHVSGVWQDSRTETGVAAGPLDLQLAAPTPGWKWNVTTGIEWKQVEYGLVIDPVAEGAPSYTLDANDVPRGGLDVTDVAGGFAVTPTAPFPEADLLYLHAMAGVDGGDWHVVAPPDTTQIALPDLPFDGRSSANFDAFALIDTGGAPPDLTTIAPTVMSSVAWLPPTTGRLRMMTLGFPFIDQE